MCGVDFSKPQIIKNIYFEQDAGGEEAKKLQEREEAEKAEKMQLLEK